LKTKGSKRDVPVGEWLTAKVMAQKKAYARPDVKRSRGPVVLLNQPYQFIQQPDQFPLLLWIEAKISAPLHMICANVGMLDGLFPALRQG